MRMELLEVNRVQPVLEVFFTTPRERFCLTGFKESNEAEAMVILEAFQLFSNSFRAKFIVESDAANAVMWAAQFDSRPWRFKYFFNEIKELSSHLHVVFCHVHRLANSLAMVYLNKG